MGGLGQLLASFGGLDHHDPVGLKAPRAGGRAGDFENGIELFRLDRHVALKVTDRVAMTYGGEQIPHGGAPYFSVLATSG